jgi:lambda family phage portal protein
VGLPYRASADPLCLLDPDYFDTGIEMNKVQKWLIKNLLGVELKDPPQPKQKPNEQTRMYANAVPNRFNQGFPSFNTSEDLELVSSLRNLRARSRALIRDAGYAKSARRAVVDNVIGTGIKMQPSVRNSRNGFNERINESIGDAWSHWMHGPNCHTGGSLHFHDMERMCMGQVFDAGEIFLRIHRGTKFGYSNVPLALEVVEPERIVDGYAYPGSVDPKSGGVRMGIETDKFRKPIAYWIRDLHPGDIRLNLEESDAVTRVDASDVIHIYVIDRWPQTRGIPWLHAAHEKLQDVDGYSEAEIIAARGAASYLGTIETPEDTSTFAQDAPDNTFQLGVEPGVWMKLSPGEKANFVAPNRPTAALDPFMRYMLREISAAIGVSYESLSHDFSQSNYSSSRLSLLHERDIWKALQMWWIRVFRHRLHREFMNAAVLAGSIPGITPIAFANDPENYMHVRFRPRGWSWVDPQKEVAAAVQSVKSGFSTVESIIEHHGNGADLEEVMIARQAELAYMKELELAFDTSPDVYVPAESRGQVLVGKDGIPAPAAVVSGQGLADAGLTPPAGVGTPEVPGLAAPGIAKPQPKKPTSSDPPDPADEDEPIAAEGDTGERVLRFPFRARRSY